MKPAGWTVAAMLALAGVAACGRAPVPPAARDAAIPMPAESPAAPAPAVAVAASPDGPRIMFVMDSSGSMWGEMDGMTRRDIARQAVRDLTAARPALASAGLVAYGHRRKGDCGDVERLRMPGAGAPLADAVDLLVPAGTTPLTDAVRAAADALAGVGTASSIILLTDGAESCGADPCALGADLARSGAALTVHVVGFGLSPGEGRQVACLAELTGGRYLGAASPAELAGALDTAAAAAEAGPPDAGAATAQIGAPDTAVIGAPFRVTWTGPGGPSDYIDLVPAGHEALSGEITFAYTGDAGPVTLRAPAAPGAYLVRYVWLAPQGRILLASAPVTVVEAEAALAAPATVDAGAGFDVTWRGPDGEGDMIDLVRRGETRLRGAIASAYTSAGNPVRLQAPAEAGDLDLRYVVAGPGKRRILKTLPLTVTPATMRLAFRPFAATGETLDVDWTGPDAQGDYVDIVPRGQTETRGELALAYTRSGNPAALRLPGTAGAYDVRYVLEAPGGRRVLATAPITVSDVAASLEPARTSASAGDRISVAWTGPGGDSDYIDIVPRGATGTSGELSYAYLTGGSPVAIKLPGDPGLYDLRYVQEAPEGRSVKAVVPVRVDAATATLAFPARVVHGAPLAVAWTGPGHEGDYIDIIEAGSDSVSGQTDYAYARYGSPAELEAPATPGAYDVRYILEGANGLRVVTRAPLVVE